MPVLYVVACDGRPAADLPEFVASARHDGWVVCVVATPDGRKFLDATALQARTLRDWGVTVLFDPASVPPLDSDTTTPPPPSPWPALAEALHALPGTRP